MKKVEEIHKKAISDLEKAEKEIRFYGSSDEADKIRQAIEILEKEKLFDKKELIALIISLIALIVSIVKPMLQ